MTAKFSPKRYADLLSVTLPQIIETETEYERALAVVEPMMTREDNLSPEEAKLFDLLVKLIQDYEEKHYPIEPVASHEVIQHLLEARSLQPQALTPLLGAEDEVAGILSGKRSLSGKQVQQLADFFHVTPELFA